MKITREKERPMMPLAEVVDAYRVSCGAEPDVAATCAFLEDLMEREASVLFVAREDGTGRVMGFANLYPSFSTLAMKPLWILNDLGVSEDFRKQGVATALIRHVLDFAGESGAVRVELKTEVENRKARALYKAIGFEEDGSHVHYRVSA